MDLVSVVVDVTQKLQANMYSLMEKCHHQLLRYMCSSVVSGYCSRSRLLPIPVAEEERNTHTHTITTTTPITVIATDFMLGVRSIRNM